LPLVPLLEPLELPVVPDAPLAPPAPPPPPPAPPPCAIAPELSASAATNESAKIVARDMLDSMLLHHSRAPPKGGVLAGRPSRRRKSGSVIERQAPAERRGEPLVSVMANPSRTKKPRRSGAKFIQPASYGGGKVGLPGQGHPSERCGRLQGGWLTSSLHQRGGGGLVASARPKRKPASSRRG